jgi:hypothetical protein
MATTYAPELEAAIEQQARQKGVSRDEFLEDIVRKSLFPVTLPLPLPEPTAEQMGRPPGGPDISNVPLDEPLDEWEEDILSLAMDCGVSLSDEAVSSEGIY